MDIVRLQYLNVPVDCRCGGRIVVGRTDVNVVVCGRIPDVVDASHRN